MSDPDQLRARAVRLYAMALQARDASPDYADRLVAEAIELQDRATDMEEVANAGEAAKRPPVDQAPKPIAQQHEQVQPNKDKE